MGGGGGGRLFRTSQIPPPPTLTTNPTPASYPDLPSTCLFLLLFVVQHVLRFELHMNHREILKCISSVYILLLLLLLLLDAVVVVVAAVVAVVVVVVVYFYYHQYYFLQPFSRNCVEVPNTDDDDDVGRLRSSHTVRNLSNICKTTRCPRSCSSGCNNKQQQQLLESSSLPPSLQRLRDGQ